MHIRIALLGVISMLLLAPAAAQADETQIPGVVKTMDLMDRSNIPPVPPGRMRLEFSSEKPEGFPAVEGLSNPLFSSVEIGGKTLLLAIGVKDEAAKGPDALLIDLNGDGAMGDGESIALDVNERPTRGGGMMVQGTARDLKANIGGKEFPLFFMYGVGGGRPLSGQAFALWYLEAPLKIGEVEYVVVFQDGDQDGSYTGDKDAWMITPATGRQRPPSPYAMNALSEGQFHEGKLYRVNVDGAHKITVKSADAEGPDPKDMASKRTRVEHKWAEIFDKEREGFVSGKNLDTSRPLAETPIDWKYVTFDEAKALAKESGKPLFIDVMAFWCVWCYRMDYYTYPDAEVAKMLNEKFVPVKIIQEQSKGDDYKNLMSELGARGIPAMGVWGPDGKLAKYISGWNKPEDFLTALEEGLAGIKTE